MNLFHKLFSSESLDGQNTSRIRSEIQATKTAIETIIDDMKTVAITKFDSSLDEKQVYNIMKYEVGIIQGTSKNLLCILKDFSRNDVLLIASINNRAKEWNCKR